MIAHTPTQPSYKFVKCKHFRDWYIYIQRHTYITAFQSAELFTKKSYQTESLKPNEIYVLVFNNPNSIHIIYFNIT